MLKAPSQPFRLTFAVSIILALSIGSAGEKQTEVRELQNPDLVQIRSQIIDGQKVDVVTAGELPEFAVRAELVDTSLTQIEKDQLSAIRRDVLDKAITGLVIGVDKSPIVVSDELVSRLTPADSAELDVFNGLREAVLSKKARKTIRERAAAIIAFLNENILKSTYRAGKSFAVASKGTKGFQEFGLSLVFRGELQIGAGKMNLMRTIARGVDIGYDLKSKELVVRTVVRAEKMDGGTAMALGPKMELRGYRANLDVQEHKSREGHVHGQSWYPPAPPLITFASESYPGYHSVGTALALNIFDVVVPTYLFNTVNEFDADYRVRRLSLSPAQYARSTVAAARRWLTPRPSANQCQAIFSRAL